MLREMWARLLGRGRPARARGDRLSEVDRLEDGLSFIEDGRFGDLQDVVHEEGLKACAKGAVDGAVGADVAHSLHGLCAQCPGRSHNNL